jgi:hypothetical protein
LFLSLTKILERNQERERITKESSREREREIDTFLEGER